MEKQKLQFISQYFGQRIWKLDGLGQPQLINGFTLMKYRLSEDDYLLLRSVNQLSDTEKEIIAKRMQIYPEDVLDWINGDCGHGDYENLHTWLPCYDILKAFGILLPFTFLNEDNQPVTLQPDEIINKTWAKLIKDEQ